MSTYLLLGAGFSANYGYPTARDLEQLILGKQEVQQDSELRKIVLNNSQGFEYALEELRCLAENGNSEDMNRYKLFQKLIKDIFCTLNAKHGFFINPFENGNMGKFLHKFDGIFTLNQDLLIEILTDGTTAEFLQPGIKSRDWKNENPLNSIRSKEHIYTYIKKLLPEVDLPQAQALAKFYIKLHGCTNIVTEDGDLMVMGCNKEDLINSHYLLRYYFDIFKDKLFESQGRLLIIGYSFRDKHVNSVLMEAIERGLKFYICDPSTELNLKNIVENIWEADESLETKYKKDKNCIRNILAIGIISYSTKKFIEIVPVGIEHDESKWSEEYNRIKHEFFCSQDELVG